MIGVIYRQVLKNENREVLIARSVNRPTHSRQPVHYRADIQLMKLPLF